MIKSELISIICNKHQDLSEESVSQTVNYIIKLLTTSMASGKRIEIRNFGSFDLHKQKRRQARNPRTGEIVITEEKGKLHFKAGKDLKDWPNKEDISVNSPA